MSKRKNNKSNQRASNAADSGGSLTVVDGNAVGVAPGGETALEITATEDGIEIAEIASNDDAITAETIEPVLDADVLAALAADGPAPAVTVDSDEPTITAEDVDPPSDEEVLAAIAATGKKAGRKSGTKTPTPAPTVMRAFTAVALIDQATLDTNLAGCNAKKVREKADNLIAAIEHGKKLSGYTKIAVKALAADGRFSGKSMVERFQAEGLSIGTSRAQAQQMTALFRLVGAVAPEAGSKDLVVQDNALIQELVPLAA